MKLNSRLTGGLAWAGVALVVGVPAANVMLPDAHSNKQVLTAAIAREAAVPGTANASDRPVAPKPATPAPAVAKVASVAPAPVSKPAAAKPVASADTGPETAVADKPATTPPMHVANASASASIPPAPLKPPAASPVATDTPPQSSGPKVEATTSSVTIIPGGKPNPSSAPAAPPQTAAPAAPVPPAAPVVAKAAPAPAQPAATTTAAPSGSDIASTPAPAADPANGSVTDVASIDPQTAGAMDAPEDPPVPAPLSMRPKAPAVDHATHTASISVSSSPRIDGGRPDAMPDSTVVIQPPTDVRPLPASPNAPIVTEDELRGWKSGTLAQYLASKGYMADNQGRQQPRVRLYRRSGSPQIVAVPSDGQYYDVPYAN